MLPGLLPGFPENPRILRGFLLFLLPSLRRERDPRQKIGDMSEQKTVPQPKTRKPRPKIRQAIVNLLAAVDKSIAAADEAKKARRDLLKLAESVEVVQ